MVSKNRFEFYLVHTIEHPLSLCKVRSLCLVPTSAGVPLNKAPSLSLPFSQCDQKKIAKCLNRLPKIISLQK